MWCSAVDVQRLPSVLQQLLEEDLSILEQLRLEQAIAIGVVCFRQQPGLMWLLLEHFQSILLSWELQTVGLSKGLLFHYYHLHRRWWMNSKNWSWRIRERLRHSLISD